MKPILKYRGGKSKEIPNYISLVPKFDIYHEPFFGGGATYFYLEPQKAFISDINNNLINFYKEISGINFDDIKIDFLINELMTLMKDYTIGYVICSIIR